jgi:hypothetical protein
MRIRICIRNRAKSYIRIRTAVDASNGGLQAENGALEGPLDQWTQIPVTLKRSWIRIHIKVESWIRIRI